MNVMLGLEPVRIVASPSWQWPESQWLLVVFQALETSGNVLLRLCNSPRVRMAGFQWCKSFEMNLSVNMGMDYLSGTSKLHLSLLDWSSKSVTAGFLECRCGTRCESVCFSKWQPRQLICHGGAGLGYQGSYRNTLQNTVFSLPLHRAAWYFFPLWSRQETAMAPYPILFICDPIAILGLQVLSLPLWFGCLIFVRNSNTFPFLELLGHPGHPQASLEFFLSWFAVQTSHRWTWEDSHRDKTDFLKWLVSWDGNALTELAATCFSEAAWHFCPNCGGQLSAW